MVLSNERSVITIVLRNPLVVVAVILESRSPGSVVIKLGLDSGTLRAGSSWAAKTLGDNSSCYCHSRKSGGPLGCRPQGAERTKNSPRKKALAPKQALGRTSKKPTILCFGRVIQQICHTLRNIPPAGLLVSIQAKLRQYSKQMVKNITLQRFVIGPNRRV